MLVREGEIVRKGRGKGSGATVKRRVVDATARAIDGFDENVVTASKDLYLMRKQRASMRCWRGAR